ncbi:hypothetical protein HELRODRAFT_171262 [Helobdella robusta]|uniref:Uncharacterized protein n=1 Tax=Helobdella robusta TaxID=6412 RepID=T1F402_HELRO|nr:hypothetical protein HELRODRAFT_171262 [Helobdella robusta]ESO05608.1 hypothetical protein HELRODRAFT_171262 [Helobdella robusta]
MHHSHIEEFILEIDSIQYKLKCPQGVGSVGSSSSSSSTSVNVLSTAAMAGSMRTLPSRCHAPLNAESKLQPSAGDMSKLQTNTKPSRLPQRAPIITAAVPGHSQSSTDLSTPLKQQQQPRTTKLRRNGSLRMSVIDKQKKKNLIFKSSFHEFITAWIQLITLEGSTKLIEVHKHPVAIIIFYHSTFV